MKQLSYLNPGLTIHGNIDYNNTIIQETYYNPEGLRAYTEDLCGKAETITDIYDTVINTDDIEVAFSFVYRETYSDSMYSFTNNINTTDGGSHLTGFKEGISRAILNYYEETSNNKSKINIISDDTREGLVGIISIKIKDANFDGQGKSKLNMPKVRKLVREKTEEYIAEVLDKNPDVAKIILAKVIDAAKAREAAKKARENVRKTKGLIEGDALKLADCISNSPEESEVWIVEG